jgi:hypothetical protein
MIDRLRSSTEMKIIYIVILVLAVLFLWPWLLVFGVPMLIGRLLWERLKQRRQVKVT